MTVWAFSLPEGRTETAKQEGEAAEKWPEAGVKTVDIPRMGAYTADSCVRN